MAEKRKVLFIINPASGTRSKQNLPALLEKHLNDAIDYNVIFTSYPGEATEISEKNKAAYDVIVAVGGDGTINEVAKPLINSQTVLGIIPVGSGNGLARHLGIPLNAKKAIKLLNQAHHTKIDTVKANNDNVFLNVAGVGFDAHIANIFAKSKKRGFFTYAKLVLQELNRFKYCAYKLIIDGREKVEDAPFTISIANATQYGNNAFIAPAARISDGMMDICVLQKVPVWYQPVLILHLFNGSIEKSKYYSHEQGKEVTIKNANYSHERSFHLDGDAFEMKQDIKFSIQPLSLKVACLPVIA